MGGGVSGEICLSLKTAGPSGCKWPRAGVASNPAGQKWTKEGQVVPTVVGAMGGISEGKTRIVLRVIK